MHRSLLQVAGAGALTLVVALATPSYAGSYRHHDPAGDMRVNTSSCADNVVNQCTTSPVTDAPDHRNSDIVGVRATYRGDRLYVAVRMRAWPAGSFSGVSNRAGSHLLGSARDGIAAAISEGVREGATETFSVDRMVWVDVKVPHRRRPAEMVVSHLQTSVAGAAWNLRGHLCRSLRTHLDRATVTLHMSMSRKCFGRPHMLKIRPFGWDSTSTDDGTTDNSTIWHDFGLRREDAPGTDFSPWIHHN